MFWCVNSFTQCQSSDTILNLLKNIPSNSWFRVLFISNALFLYTKACMNRQDMYWCVNSFRQCQKTYTILNLFRKSLLTVWCVNSFTQCQSSDTILNLLKKIPSNSWFRVLLISNALFLYTKACMNTSDMTKLLKYIFDIMFWSLNSFAQCQDSDTILHLLKKIPSNRFFRILFISNALFLYTKACRNTQDMTKLLKYINAVLEQSGRRMI